MDAVRITDVRSIYKQWQEGKLLNLEEQKALKSRPPEDRSSLIEGMDSSFADVLTDAKLSPGGS